MRTVEMKRVGPPGAGVPGAFFSPAVITHESPWGFRYYRPCRPDLVYNEDKENVVIRSVGHDRSHAT